MLSFQHHEEEFKVGDFIFVKNKEDKIFQILTIGYQKNDKLHPDLCFSASEFTKANSFFKLHRRVKKPSRVSSNEYIKEEEKIILKPRQIESSTSIFPYAGHPGVDEDRLFCRFEVQAGTLVEYKPLHVSFCDEFIETGIYYINKHTTINFNLFYSYYF